MDVAAVIPLKGFAVAKGRLAGSLSTTQRAELARATAHHVITTCLSAGLTTSVVSSDPEVTAMAGQLDVTLLPDPGSGLDGAAAAGARAAKGSWIVLHGDLPLLTPRCLRPALAALGDGSWFIAPSCDGGTNLLGGLGAFEFAYGPGSFHRHLGRIGRDGRACVIGVDAATAVEVDTPRDLATAARLGGGAWLSPFLS